MHHGAAYAQLLLHPARQLLRRAIGKLTHPDASEQFIDAGMTLLSVLSKQTGKKINIFKDGQSRVKIAPQSLRHISNAGAISLACLPLAHIHPEHLQPALLQLASAGNQRSEERRVG